jgi:hypothetical protein
MEKVNDGFTLVTRRGGGGRRGAAAPAASVDSHSSSEARNLAAAAPDNGTVCVGVAASKAPRRSARRSRAAAAATDASAQPAALAAGISRSCEKLGALLFAGALRRALRAFLAAARGGGGACGCCVDVLALGLGSLSHGSSAGAGAASATGVQAATLLLLGRMLAEEGGGGGGGGGGSAAMAVRCFDPVATAADEEVLRALGFAVLSADEAAGASAVRRCSNSGGGSVPLVAFLPHCDGHVYDRLLRGCAADLPRLCLVGNSLTWYHLAGNVAAVEGCEELARIAALAVTEVDAYAAAAGGGGGDLRPVETPLPLDDCDAAAERALNATSVHVFRAAAASLHEAARSAV